MKWIPVVVRGALFLLFILTTEEQVAYAQGTALVQVKTFNKNLEPFTNLELSLDNKQYFKTGNDGKTIVKINNSLLPPKTIFFVNKGLEAESWNYSKGVLEIIVRRKTHEIYSIYISDSTGTPVVNIVVAFNTSQKRNKATTNQQGMVQFAVPLNVDATKPNAFNINGYSIIESRFEDKNGYFIVASNALQPPPLINTQIAKNEGKLTIDNLDSLHTLTEFYLYIKDQNLTALSTDQKTIIDNKFDALLSEFKDSHNQDSPLIDEISDSTLINEDIIFLTEQALREGQFIQETREAIDRNIELISEKLTKGGGSFTDAERKKILADIDELDKLLKSNEIQFTRNQENFKVALDELKNKLLTIKELEEQLSASEKQRIAERNASRKQIATYLVIIAGLLLLIFLFIYLIRKFNRQRKELTLANAEVKRINDNLEQIVAKKTESLVKANNELDTFLYHSSHNLKRPLSTIIGLANLSRLTTHQESNVLFSKTKQTADEMNGLLQKLVMVNDINHPSDSRSIYFSSCIDKVSRDFNEFVKQNGIDFSTEISDEIYFSSNPVLLEIVIRNLLENALFYSSLTKQDKPKVTIVVKKEDTVISFSISDNGEGISENIRNNIWDMFFVGNVKSTGSGLGLYISKRAVEAMHGSISFIRRENKWTTFNVAFPIDNSSVPTSSVV